MEKAYLVIGILIILFLWRTVDLLAMISRNQRHQDITNQGIIKELKNLNNEAK